MKISKAAICNTTPNPFSHKKTACGTNQFTGSAKVRMVEAINNLKKR